MSILRCQQCRRHRRLVLWSSLTEHPSKKPSDSLEFLRQFVRDPFREALVSGDHRELAWLIPIGSRARRRAAMVITGDHSITALSWFHFENSLQPHCFTFRIETFHPLFGRLPHYYFATVRASVFRDHLSLAHHFSSAASTTKVRPTNEGPIPSGTT